MRKILYNRVEPNENEIRNNQNFDLVLKKYREAKRYWQNPWFYGAVGLASITSFLCLLGL
jgi:hypothetical protein